MARKLYQIAANFKNVRKTCDIMEFKKVRRSLQRKRHVKIELFFGLSVFTIIPCLSRYTKQAKCTFCFFGTNAFHVKAENEKLIAADLRCRQNLKYENFTSSFGRRTTSKTTPKIVPHVQHDCFSSFNQSNH